MNSTDYVNLTESASKTYFHPSVLFISLIILFIPSILCYLYIFIQFSCKRHLCRNIHQHLVLIILIFSFLQVISEQPLTLFYLHNGISLFQTKDFCKFWSAQDFVLGGIILMFICYSSVERYLLIFHRAFIFRHLLILHYLPIIICIIYPSLFYIGIIYIYPCINQFDYTMNLCGGPCFVFDKIPSTFDVLFNLALFETMGVSANIILVSRVIIKKHRMKQQNLWKKNRRLLIQVLSITLLHNLILILIVTFVLIELFSSIHQSILLDLTYNVLQYGIYLVHLLCPFVSLVGLPELWPCSIIRLFRQYFLTNNTVQPTIQIPLRINRTL